MTTWIEDPRGGRERGPRGLVRAWVEVLFRPDRFFRNGVSPGDQAPGLTFAVVVAVAFAGGWLAVDPAATPAIADSRALSAVATLFVVAVLAAPVALHLTAAVAVITTLLASLTFADGVGTRDRGGVSETVQVVAYASAPFALAGPPIPELRVLCGAYATLLLVVGLRTVHATTWPRALVAGIPPALLGYGVGYRVVAAARTLVGA